MSTAYAYDYYKIELPGDLFDATEEEAVERLGQAAINEAGERARLYCIPAVWTARLVKGDPGDWFVTFLVRRKRRRLSTET